MVGDRELPRTTVVAADGENGTVTERTVDIADGNFRCDGETLWPEILGEADRLWHWSRRPGLLRAPATFELPPEAGLLLPANSRLVVQIVYNNQQNNDGRTVESSDLRSLTSRQLWQGAGPHHMNCNPTRWPRSPRIAMRCAYTSIEWP